jgi:hypothetical protein
MYLNDLFVYKESRYSFRKTNTVEVPQVRTTYHGLHSFRFAGATLWNELPNELQNVSSLSQFFLDFFQFFWYWSHHRNAKQLDNN